MSAAVDILCLLTSLACALLLLRGYRDAGVRLLLWSGLCFACFAVGSVMLLLDKFVYPDANLMLLRRAPTSIGLLLLVGGMIWDTT